MHAERDYLRDFVFQELDENLRDRRCYLEPVDLRWGVETVSINDQEAKELLALTSALQRSNAAGLSLRFCWEIDMVGFFPLAGIWRGDCKIMAEWIAPRFFRLVVY